MSRYQKGKTNPDFTEARDSEWQWHQLGHMQVCTSLYKDNHASTPPLSFLQAGCPSCHPTNSVKALNAETHIQVTTYHHHHLHFPVLTFGPTFSSHAYSSHAFSGPHVFQDINVTSTIKQ